MNKQPVYVVKIPNNYIDYQAEASFCDTLAFAARGEIMSKGRDEAKSRAWLRAVQAIVNGSIRQKHFTKVALLEDELLTVISDMRYFATLPLDGYDPFDKPRMRRHAKQCANAIVKYESLIAMKKSIAESSIK